MRHFLTFALFLWSFALTQAQTLDTNKLDRYFEVLFENDKFMGSIAVSKDGQLIYTKSVGYADQAQGLEATEKTKYRIGSITKSFTAVLIFKAHEQGLLDLEATIDQWFPEVPNAPEITVSHLLNHRSGIFNFTNDPDYLTWNTEAKSEEEMVALVVAGGSVFKPDSRAEYSNSNYVLLTFILEKVFKASYADLVRIHITEPNGLKDTNVFGKMDTADNESKSYQYAGLWKEEAETDFTIPLGAGAITATASDLTRFGDALFGGRLLQEESLKLMTTITEGYGRGIFQVPFHEHTGFGHSGGIDGFRSMYTHFPKDKLTYAMTSNGLNTNSNAISIAVLSAVYGQDFDIPEFSTYAVAAEDLDAYLGVYATDQIPLKVTVTKKGNTLIAQGSGQPPFALEATDRHKFKLDMVGAEFEFHPENNTMVVFQGGGQITFTKE